jgi:short-subunit dehydrogenase
MFENRSALITGASSGIGEALAKELASEGAAVILTARREDRLQQLAKECRAGGAPSAEIIVADLSDPAGPSLIVEELRRRGQSVDILVNCAGAGEYGRFVDQELSDVEAMMRLNVMGLVGLTRLLCPEMILRRKGWVLNVASTAAFQPTPYMAVYGATKSFVLDFSMAIGEELRGTGVRVTCLCPGPVRTGFFNRGGYESRAGDFQRLAASADFVARKAIRGLKYGKRVVIPGWMNKLSALVVRLASLKAVTRVSGRILGPRR